MPRAKVSKVSIGLIEFQALLVESEDGSVEFAIGASQVAELFSFDTNQASRDLKALLGAGLPFDKIKTELNSKPVNTISFKQFELVILRLACKGNPIAVELAESCIALSLQQRACDAFGLVFEKSDREAWLAARFGGKVKRTKFTDEIKVWLIANETSERAKSFVYAEVSDEINMAVTGQRAGWWKKEHGITSLRDSLAREALETIAEIEKLAGKRIKAGTNPKQAVLYAIEMLEVDTIENPLINGGN